MVDGYDNICDVIHESPQTIKVYSYITSQNVITFFCLYSWPDKSYKCYSTVTCKVLLNQPHSKLGQYWTVRCSMLTRQSSRGGFVVERLLHKLRDSIWMAMSYGTLTRNVPYFPLSSPTFIFIF